MKEIINVAIDAAKEVGDFLLENFGKVREIMKKGDRDFATNLDKEAEEMIIDKIRTKFPNHGIIAEESGSSSPDREYLWIIDPLDGTHNFMRNIDIFGVSIGIVQREEFVGGVIYMPKENELYVGQKGAGAYKNDKKIKGFPYSRFFLLPLIPVYCGIRKAGSFDGIFPPKKAESVQKVCNELGIHNKKISLGKNTKILFAKDKKTLDRLIRLHDKVFIVKTNKEAHREYGLLLGYPRCCIDALADSGFSSSSTMYLSLNNPWPWKLNLFSEPPLIHHYPCSSGCKESLEIATKTLDVYSVFAPHLAGIRDGHSKSILYFDENIYIRFKGMNKIIYSRRLEMTVVKYDKIEIHNPERIEDGRLSQYHKNLLEKLSYFKKGNKIIVTDSQITVLKNKTIISAYKKRSIFDGAFIIFK